MPNSPDSERLRQLAESARALPPADREAHVRQEAGGDHALRDAALQALSDDDAETQATTDGVDAAPSTGDRVQSSATDELMDRLEESPKLDVERYEFEGEVDRGGMGAILKIHDRHLNRRLAMKVLLDREPPRDELEEKLAHQLLGRFLEEAQVTSQLDHPGVVPVHELGLDQNGKVFFTMRLIKGRTASAVFREAYEGGEEWTVTRSLEVLLKVCDTMAFAHNKGILHRDLKPDNVMVGRFGEVYVMDWGLAKVLGQGDHHDLRIRPEDETAISQVDSARGRDAEEDAGSSVVSMDGQKLGTPSYMSPEQARSEDLDPRADVYSIGAMLYQLLCGRAPYTTPGVKKYAYRILEDVAHGPPRRVEEITKEVPAELVAIVEKAMERDADRRYADVTVLAADLRAYLDQRAVQAHRTGAVVELKLWVRRNKPLAASLAATILLLVVGLATALVLRQEAQEKSELAEERQKELMGRNQQIVKLNTNLEASNRASRWSAYRAGLLAAQAAIDDRAFGVARDLLDECPKELREWEWQHLAGYCSQGKSHHAHRSIGLMAYDPSRNVVATGGSGDSLIKLWSWPDLTLLHELAPDGGAYIQDLVFTADGRFVAAFAGHTGSAHVGLEVWDVRSGNKVGVLPEVGRVNASLVAANGSEVLAISTGTVWLCELDRMTAEETFSEDYVRATASSFAAATGDLELGGALRLSTNDWTPSIRPYGREHLGYLNGAATSASGSYLAIAGHRTDVATDRSRPVLFLFDRESGRRLAEVPSHDETVSSLSFAFEDSTLITTSWDKTIRLWDVPSLRLALEIGGHDDWVVGATTPAPGVILAATKGGELITHHLDGIRPVRTTDLRGEITSIAFHPTEPRLTVVGHLAPQPGTLEEYEYPGLKAKDSWFADAGGEASRGSGAYIQCVAYSPDGSLLATGHVDWRARVFDSKSRDLLAVHEESVGQVDSVAFDSLGQRVATLSTNATLRVCDARSGACHWEIPSRTTGTARGTVWSASDPVVFANHDELVVAAFVSELRFYDASSGALVLEVEPGVGVINGLSSSADGQLLAVAGRNGLVLIDPVRGTSIARLDGHDGQVTAVSFRGSNRLASASRDGTVRIWDVEFARDILVLDVGPMVTTVAWSPDGSFLAAGTGYPGRLTLWHGSEGR